VQGPAAGIALIVCSFLIGAIPWGYVAGKLGGVDLRTVGSGSTGATNVLRTLGTKASAAVFVLDFLKGLFPVLVARSVGFESEWLAAAAVATVAGHCWSPFIQFKGGKGMATGAGALIALFPQMIVVVPVVLATIWLTRLVSLGSLLAVFLATAVALVAAITGHVEWSIPVATVAIGAIIVFRHRQNIDRLRQGTERRLGERVTA
jgi:acyl phosphate:glycerol-3-phosphate acyltransferase